MNGRKATGVWSFHGKEHEINLDTNDDKVTIEVQDIETADQWRASFLSKRMIFCYTEQYSPCLLWAYSSKCPL